MAEWSNKPANARNDQLSEITAALAAMARHFSEEPVRTGATAAECRSG